jgi:hypothetical protein
MSRIAQLEKLASEMIGDGKSPNVYFVTVSGNVIAITINLSTAHQIWESVSNQRSHETTLEDRQTGVIASVEPESDRPGARLVMIDEYGYRPRRAQKLMRPR